MKLVVILNINPDENVKTKISNNREYTRRELKTILSNGFSGFIQNIVFYSNFEEFKQDVHNHIHDFVLNFDFGYKSRTRNMNVPAFCEIEDQILVLCSYLHYTGINAHVK